ncbi:MAG TPA: hypothetical protein VFM82_01795 [Flavobacteriaceae bacterium]|nr:hypothetical protein [Flavobacteriaceae bacterium]
MICYSFPLAKKVGTFILISFLVCTFFPIRAIGSDLNIPTQTNPDSMQSVRIAQALVLLSGPWRFQMGDQKKWADPNFNDSNWETFSLKPAPGAHDSDVGLTNYVSGQHL